MTPVVVSVIGVEALITELVVTVVCWQEEREQVMVEVKVMGIVKTPLEQIVVPVVVVVNTVVVGATGVVEVVSEIVLFWKGAGGVVTALVVVKGLVIVEVMTLVISEVEGVLRVDVELVV